MISALALLPVLLPFVRHTHLRVVSPRTGLVALLVVVGLLMLIAVALAIPKLRQRGRSAVRQAVGTMRSLVTSRRAARLLIMSLALTLTYGACLYFALLAVGVSPSIPHVLLISIIGEGIGAAAPTQGGIGATEAAMVSGLLLVGISSETAIAGVLIYRLISFWLPMAPGFIAFRRLSKQGRL